MQAKNLFLGDEQLDFWVWVNPTNWHARYQITTMGSFFSAGQVGQRSTNLPFLPNPDFNGDVSPFSIGVTHEYTAEYNFEVNRAHYFGNYPSRLNAIFLLASESEAQAYAARHVGHVGGRVLKRVRTVGPYCYSAHDSSWVDFLRQRHGMDDDTIHNVTQAYWRGVNVEDCELQSMGARWTQSPIREVLYLGRVEFYDRSLVA